MKKLAWFCICAVLSVPMLHATIVTTTITGYVYGSGTNSVNGDSLGNGKIFGTAAHLDGLPFKLVYTFDSTLGTPYGDTFCSDMSVATSGVQNSGSSNPGTAVLSIYASDGVTLLGSFIFGSGGTYTPSSMISYTTRAYDGDCGSSDDAVWSVEAIYTGTIAGTATVPFKALPSTYPSGHLSASGTWTTPISTENIYSGQPTPDRFTIDLAQGSTSVAYAIGYLTAASTTTTYTVTN